MEAIMANSIEHFKTYQMMKLNMKVIEMQEFRLSEQQKSAEIVEKFSFPEAIKIDVESILEPLATEQETTSEFEQHPWQRDIVSRIKRMGAIATSASIHLYKSRVKLKERPCKRVVEGRVWKEKSGLSEMMLDSRQVIKGKRSVIMYCVGRSMIIES
jgi:hypothetical protein